MWRRRPTTFNMHPPNHQLLDARFLSSLRFTFADERVGRSIESCIIIYIPLFRRSLAHLLYNIAFARRTTHDDALCLVLGSCYLCIWSVLISPLTIPVGPFSAPSSNPLTSPLSLAISFQSPFLFWQNRVSRWTISASPWALTPFFIYPRIYTYHHFHYHHPYLLLVRTRVVAL